MNLPVVKVLDIPLWAGNLRTATNHVIETALTSSKNNLRISASGAHGLVISKRDKSFKNCLQNFYLNLPDGMPGVWIGRMKGAGKIDRCYGPDFFKMMMMSTSTLPIRHFFCGGKEGVADELKQVCANNFGNQNIVGTFCPPFRELTENEWIDLGMLIDKCNSEIVWIGLSTPKQEAFAQQLSQFCHSKFIVTVGAAFDFHTDRISFAPKWMQNAGLEWLFRLISEPKRLYKRYFTIVPLFILYNLKEYFNYLIKKSN